MRKIFGVAIAIGLEYLIFSMCFLSLKMAEWTTYGHDAFYIIAVVIALIGFGNNSNNYRR